MSELRLAPARKFCFTTIRKFFRLLGLEISRSNRKVPPFDITWFHVPVPKLISAPPRFGIQAIIDVGANDGRDALELAQSHTEFQIFAFEPTPELVEKISSNMNKAFPEQKPKNFTIVPMAVGESEGIARFHVNGMGDWGCSSLRQMKSDATNIPGRELIGITHQIDVRVVRLDTFCREHDIRLIGFIHIDAQGADLSVLKSLGPYLSCVQAGVLEASTSAESSSYVTDNTIQNVCCFLRDSGFEITHITPNNAYYDEVNIHFRNPKFKPL
jgi:FkbM family methyltransferase